MFHTHTNTQTHTASSLLPFSYPILLNANKFTKNNINTDVIKSTPTRAHKSQNIKHRGSTDPRLRGTRSSRRHMRNTTSHSGLCLNVKQPSVPTACPLLILGVFFKKKERKFRRHAAASSTSRGSPWCGRLNYRAALVTFVITGEPARLLHILHWADSYMWNATNINKTTRDGGKEWIRRILRHAGRGEKSFLETLVKIFKVSFVFFGYEYLM